MDLNIKLNYHRNIAYEGICNNDVLGMNFTDLKLPTIAMVSQNVTKNRPKTRGQDVISVSQHFGFTCNVLCDGHDLEGYDLALDVCDVLPKVLFQLMSESNQIESASLPKETVEHILTDKLFNKAFETTNGMVGGFAKGAPIKPGRKALIISGRHKDTICEVVKVSETKGDYIVVRFNSTTVELPYDTLHGLKHLGGSTCVCIMYHNETKVARVAACGDSRLMLIPPKEVSLLPDPLFKELREGEQLMGYLTQVHQLSEQSEVDRIKNGYDGLHIIQRDQFTDVAMLVHPTTKDAVEPTRGFGDVAMWGTGYINTPDVSNLITLPVGTVILAASDGIFDDNIQDDIELLKMIKTQGKELGVVMSNANDFGDVKSKVLNGGLQELGNKFYTECLDCAYQTYASDVIDDISLFCSVVL